MTQCQQTKVTCSQMQAQAPATHFRTENTSRKMRAKALTSLSHEGANRQSEQAGRQTKQNRAAKAARLQAARLQAKRGCNAASKTGLQGCKQNGAARMQAKRGCKAASKTGLQGCRLQAGKQASKQKRGCKAAGCKQASKQASKRASKRRES